MEKAEVVWGTESRKYGLLGINLRFTFSKELPNGADFQKIIVLSCDRYNKVHVRRAEKYCFRAKATKSQLIQQL